MKVKDNIVEERTTSKVVVIGELREKVKDKDKIVAVENKKEGENHSCDTLSRGVGKGISYVENLVTVTVIQEDFMDMESSKENKMGNRKAGNRGKGKGKEIKIVRKPLMEINDNIQIPEQFGEEENSVDGRG
ncbi:hypothetical protein ACH5RR_037638 [Cinchona calisaya]|uniref:Uncharacterized protein n=1 Tax=Cinchona calisaya TaxID=153742 RepID=A0ABD2Y6R7_9GENT